MLIRTIAKTYKTIFEKQIPSTVLQRLDDFPLHTLLLPSLPAIDTIRHIISLSIAALYTRALLPSCGTRGIIALQILIYLLNPRRSSLAGTVHL